MKTCSRKWQRLPVAAISVACFALACIPLRDEHSSNPQSGQVIATLNGHKLHREDLPAEQGPILEHYISTWAAYTLLGEEAEKRLPQEVVERARRQANFLYYKLLADALLDTLANQIARNTPPPELPLPATTFYDTAHFPLTEDIVRLRLIAFNEDTTIRNNLHFLLCDSSFASRQQIDSLCREAAMCLNDTTWYSTAELQTLLAEFGGENLPQNIVFKKPLRNNSSGVAFFCVHEVKRAGEAPPVEWVRRQTAQLKRELQLKKIKDSLWMEALRKAISIVNVRR